MKRYILRPYKDAYFGLIVEWDESNNGEWAMVGDVEDLIEKIAAAKTLNEVRAIIAVNPVRSRVQG